MNTQLQVWILFSACLCLWPYKSSAQTKCHHIPKFADSPLASVCEADEYIDFDFSGEKFRKNRLEFVTQLKDAVKVWMDGNHLGSSDITSTTIRVWLTVPDSDPANAQGRLEIAIHNQNVVLAFNPKHDSHIFEDNHVGILGAAHYPTTFGWRPQSILIQATDEDETKITNLAFKAGIEISEAFAKNWYYGKTSLLNEQFARLELLRLDPFARIVVSSQVNQVLEWIGSRGQILEIDW